MQSVKARLKKPSRRFRSLTFSQALYEHGSLWALLPVVNCRAMVSRPLPARKSSSFRTSNAA